MNVKLSVYTVEALGMGWGLTEEPVIQTTKVSESITLTHWGWCFGFANFWKSFCGSSSDMMGFGCQTFSFMIFLMKSITFAFEGLRAEAY
jgi:hypothetical protein